MNHQLMIKTVAKTIAGCALLSAVVLGIVYINKPFSPEDIKVETYTVSIPDYPVCSKDVPPGKPCYISKIDWQATANHLEKTPIPFSPNTQQN